MISEVVQRHRLALIAGFATLILGLGAGAAMAGQATSTTASFSTGGVSYQDYAAINTAAASAYAVTVVKTTSGTAPTGWAGANARLFTSGGALSCESGFAYNSSPLTTSGALNPTSCVQHTSGTWYSYGVARGWNGSAYNSYYTFVSPNQNS